MNKKLNESEDVGEDATAPGCSPKVARKVNVNQLSQFSNGINITGGVSVALTGLKQEQQSPSASFSLCNTNNNSRLTTSAFQLHRQGKITASHAAPTVILPKCIEPKWQTMDFSEEVVVKTNDFTSIDPILNTVVSSAADNQEHSYAKATGKF